jgi:hypothetical protein
LVLSTKTCSCDKFLNVNIENKGGFCVFLKIAPRLIVVFVLMGCAGPTFRLLRGRATFALVKGKKDNPEGTKAKLQIEGRAPTAIAVVKFDPWLWISEYDTIMRTC